MSPRHQIAEPETDYLWHTNNRLSRIYDTIKDKQQHFRYNTDRFAAHDGTSPTDTKLFSSDPMHKVGPSE
ncbi:unnamed protein product, partial [Adineta steineri]